MTIESDQRAVGRRGTARVSSPNVFPASNSSRPNRRLFFVDEDHVRSLSDTVTVNSRPQNRGPTTTSEEPDIHGHKLILEELKNTNSRLDSDLQALDSRRKSLEQVQLSFLTPSSSGTDRSDVKNKTKVQAKVVVSD